MGWLDLVALRYSARLNGFTALAVTLLDVLSGLPTLKVCTAYRYRGELREQFLADGFALAECEPIYTELPGWDADLSACRRRADLPRNAQAYLDFIEDYVQTPIKLISVGPNREQTILD